MEQNNNHKLRIAQALTDLAEYYGKVLTKNQVTMYTEDLADLEFGQLYEAALLYRRDPANKFFPLPGQLRALAHPEGSNEEEGALIASRISGAIARIGPYRHEDARRVLGEIAWALVTNHGGWEAICNVQTDELPILKAQWRREASTLLAKFKRGEVLKQHALQIEAKTNGPMQLAEFAKKISDQTKK